jgi:hypothetical protein
MKTAYTQLVNDLLAQSNSFEEFRDAYLAKRKAVLEELDYDEVRETYGSGMVWEPQMLTLQTLWDAKEAWRGPGMKALREEIAEWRKQDER